MYDLLDELDAALYSLQDAIDSLKHFSEEKSIIEEVYDDLDEQRRTLQAEIDKNEDADLAALERDYFKDVI